MPQFLIDWNQWWLAFWIGHPIVFWGVIAIVSAISIASRRLR